MNVIHILNWEYKVTCTKNYGDSGNDQLKMNKQEDKQNDKARGVTTVKGIL